MPPADLAEKAINFHLDWYLELGRRVAEIQIEEIKANKLSDGVYEVNVFLTNPGWLPTSIAQGRRAMTSWPIRVKLNLNKDQEIFSGHPLVIIPIINGSGEVKKVTWTIRAKKGSQLSVEASSPKLEKITRSIILP